ncbi:7TM GPCR protein [Aphelenchoides avenae]|nr:7TM GPCR protein [Aphelenchus avenae]
MNHTLRDGTLIIGDGFFANLRPLRHYGERVSFVLSIMCNSVLAVLLLRERNETMRPYSRVLLINVAFDCLYAVMNLLVEWENEFNEGVYILVLNGPMVTHISAGWQKLAMSMWVAATCAACCSSTVEFIFRFFLVVKLKLWQLLLCALVVCLNGVVDGIFFHLAMDYVEDHQATFGHLMSHPMWRDVRSFAYFGADKTNPYFLLFLFSMTLQDTAILGIIAISSVTTFRVLRESRHSMSAKTRYMQSQLNRLMFAEVFSLVSVAIIPIACVMPFVFLNVKYVGCGVVIAIFMQWIPIVNPVTTILLVGPYRRKFLAPLYRRISSVDALGSSNQSAGQQNESGPSLAMTQSSLERRTSNAPSGPQPESSHI